MTMSSSDEDANSVAAEALAIVPTTVITAAAELPPSTYEIRPNLTNAFKGTVVKQIVNEVLQETLSGNENNIYFSIKTYSFLKKK